MSTTLNISKIQRFSVDDGPGIRSTVFLKMMVICAAVGAIIQRI